MDCDGNAWKTPPPAVVEQGLKAIVRYHQATERSGSTESWTLKVVAVGAVCAGKSSLVKSLMKRGPQLVTLAERTRGVDVQVGEPFKPDESKQVKFVFWDFAGHDDYHSTHSLFLSGGALFLLVVDLARFVNDPSSRSDAVHIWLDTLLCRTPGAVVQVVATHVDHLTGNHEEAVQQLRQVVSNHLQAKSHEQTLAWKKSGLARNNVLPTLKIVQEIIAVSCKEGRNWLEVGRALAKLAVDGTIESLSSPTEVAIEGVRGPEGKLFPSVGQKVPVIWVRACAVMNALRDGFDPNEAVALETVSADVVNLLTPQLPWGKALRVWARAITNSDFSEEVGDGGAAAVLKVRNALSMFAYLHFLCTLSTVTGRSTVSLRTVADH